MDLFRSPFNLEAVTQQLLRRFGNDSRRGAIEEKKLLVKAAYGDMRHGCLERIVMRTTLPGGWLSVGQCICIVFSKPNIVLYLHFFCEMYLHTVTFMNQTKSVFPPIPFAICNDDVFSTRYLYHYTFFQPNTS